MLKSPSELWTVGKGATERSLKIDPRPDVKVLYERLNTVNYKKWSGEHEPWFFDRSVEKFEI